MATATTKRIQGKAGAYPKEGLARVSEAATFLSISREVVYRLVKRGELAHVLVNDAIRVPWESLHALTRNTKRGTAKKDN